MPTAPLAGIRVVELASFVAAPAAGALLADLGAEVIKVEVPWGEIYRHSLPRFAGLRSDFGLAPHFHMDNRGKRSVALDLALPAGGRGAAALVDRADVLLTNVLAGAARQVRARPGRRCARGGPSSSSRGSRGSGRSAPRRTRPPSTTRATGRAPVSWTCCTSPTPRRRSSGRAWATTRPRSRSCRHPARRCGSAIGKAAKRRTGDRRVAAAHRLLRHRQRHGDDAGDRPDAAAPRPPRRAQPAVEPLPHPRRPLAVPGHDRVGSLLAGADTRPRASRRWCATSASRTRSHGIATAPS